MKVVIEKANGFNFTQKCIKFIGKLKVTSSQTWTEPKLISTPGPFLLTLSVTDNKASDKKSSRCVTLCH